MRVDVVVQGRERVIVGRSMQRAAARYFDVVTVYSLTRCKDTQKARRRPSNLTIIPPDDQQFTSSPLSSPYNATLVSSTSNIMAIFSDMLRSPALSAGVCPRSASVHKPLSTRSRSTSVPSTPNLPVELPGSLLQHNQGFPYLDTQDFDPSRPTSQNVRRGTHPPDRRLEDEGDVFDLLHLFPEPLIHSKSVPSLNAGYRESAMKSSRAGAAPNASVNNKSKPHRVHHRKALSDIEWRTIADSNSGNDSNTVVPSDTSLHGNASKDSNKSYVESNELLHPPPAIFEAGVPNEPADRCASRRNEVSTNVSLSWLCTRRVRTAHKETVSDRSHPPTQLSWHALCLKYVDYLVAIDHGIRFSVFVAVVVVLTRAHGA